MTFGRVQEAGAEHLSLETEQDPEELRGVIHRLGVRSEILCILAPARGIGETMFA